MPEIDFYGKIDIDHTKVLKNYGAWQQSGQIIKRTQSHRQRTNQLVAVVLCLCSLQCSACVQGSAHYSVLLGSLRDGPMLMHFFIPSLRPFPPLCLLSLLFSWLWFPAILFAFQSRSISVLSAAPFHHKHFIGSALTLTEAERWGGFSCKVSLEVCWSQNQLWKKSPKKKKSTRSTRLEATTLTFWPGGRQRACAAVRLSVRKVCIWFLSLQMWLCIIHKQTHSSQRDTFNNLETWCA